MSETTPVQSGAFLVADTPAESVLTPEDFTTEQHLYAKTARDFIEKEVLPAADRIEEKDFDTLCSLLRKAGELGLLMVDIPEEFGGLGLDRTSSALVAESISGQGSFSVVFGAHVGIGTLPLVYYGPQELKESHLPGLGDGSRVACYCLTEPTAGSDALSIRCKATLSEDGSEYLLNGTKMWITNAGMADVFTVFAKVDGEHFTCFLLDRDTPGLKIGPEEHKLGICGTSTTSVLFEDARVPADRVLGEVGQGHKIAFNVLNIGRFKLGAACVGSCKRVLEHALAYALERKQFGQRIAEFGAIGEKLADMYARTYAAESVVYRTVGLLDRYQAEAGESKATEAIAALESYSIECAIVKVLCSEALDFVADEAVQIYGGYGYSTEYPVESYYRDSRINRIFEGTNEINRLLISGMLLRKAAQGELPLFQAAKALQEELMGIPSLDFDAEPDPLESAAKCVASLKKIVLLAAGLAAQKHGKALANQQPLLLRLADLTIAAYTAESTLLRAMKNRERHGGGGAEVPVAVAQLVCETAVVEAYGLAGEILAALEEGDTLTTLLAALRRLVRRTPPDTIALRQVLAAGFVERAAFPW